MKLKQITWSLFILFFVIAFSSCNDSTEYTTTAPSEDAQIYSFKLRAIPNTAIDTLSYSVLAKTKFAIDQLSEVIYNPDSLPYKTKLKKFAAAITFSNASPSKVELIYPKDSIVEWNRTDSIDFSIPLYPKIKVYPASGNNPKVYTVKILIHKIDPDTLVWKKVNALQQPSNVGVQKTILRGNTFYTFSVDKDGSLNLYTADKTGTSWKKEQISGLTASSVMLESITLFNDKFYAVDNTKKAYSSVDGITWNSMLDNVHSILGVLPEATAAKDSLLVITEQSGKHYFAKTIDMQTLSIVKNISSSPLSNEVPSNFLSSGFSSVINYDRSNLSKNILSLTGGKDFSGAQTNLTWSIRSGSNSLEVMSNSNNTPVFAAAPGISCFIYDGYLYALTKNLFYRTSSAGSKWTKAGSKEAIDPLMPKAFGQSIIVDGDNYIWVFGGVSDSGANPIQQVWRGRINRLNP